MAVYAVAPRLGPVHATVRVPGSKSVANRALICAALADGESVLADVPPGDDSEALLDCLIELGIGVLRDGGDVHVRGGIGLLRPGPATLPARLAGTTSRFVTALAALGPGPYTIDGGAPLRARPMAPLHDALWELGAGVQPGAAWGHLPVEITGPLATPHAQVAMRGDVSSQYLSALMLIAPCLPNGMRIALTTDLVSRPYIGITAAVMAAFGVGGVEIGEREVRVRAGAYTPRPYRVEADASSASYPFAAAAICGGSVTVPGLTSDSLQGDAAFADVLAQMGCAVDRNADGTTVTRTAALRGISIDIRDMSDLVPTLAVVAAFASTPTTITGVGFIRAKESDRIGDLCAELRRAGVDAAEQADGLVVAPSTPESAELLTHHDHRLAMALALLGLRTPGLAIADPGVVAKSWPAFWAVLEALA